MISTTPSLTDRGKSLLMRAIAGESIIFTRFKIGDGELQTGQTSDMLNDLIHVVLEFPIVDLDSSKEGYVGLSGEFDSGDVENDFLWRELGVFAKGEDDVEILYAYANDGEDAGMLRALNTEILTEQTVTLIVAIGEAEHVTAVFSPRQQYALKTEFENHASDGDNPHNVTKAQVGLENVPNTHPQNTAIAFQEAEENSNLSTGETLKILMGKIAKVIRSFLAHVANMNNPHGVTLEDVGGAESEHTHSASDIESGTLPIARGGTGVDTLDGLKGLIGTNAQMGVYAGDGTVKRLVALDFRPSAVILCNSGGMMGDSEKGVCGGFALGAYGLRSTASTLTSHATTWDNDYTALLIDDTGFFVNYHESSVAEERIATNKSGETYYYIAYR